ncbi:MAG: ferrous iron transport protein B [Oscillospiraceae bacterium]|nr:ferrous iron transport protein B [Oscillospiraceae bacterium]
MDDELTLAELPVGCSAIITEIEADAAERARLSQLGLTAGTELICRLRAAGGSPVAFSVRGVTFALRDTDCRRIRLRAARPKNSRTYLLAGNPNVGKSTVFNALTGLKQHTGNWCGKTVTGAVGHCTYRGQHITLIDTPGTCSLRSETAEESAAAEVLLHTPHDCVFCICDATAPERGIRLALELLECGEPVILAVNLMDEAERQGIRIDRALLSAQLGIPVVTLSARKKGAARALLDAAADTVLPPEKPPLRYSEETEAEICRITGSEHSSRFAAVSALLQKARQNPDAESKRTAAETERVLLDAAHRICAAAVQIPPEAGARTRLADRLLTGPLLRIPLMLLLFLLVFWLTLVGANYPSKWLAAGCSALCAAAKTAAGTIGLPQWLSGALIDGALRGTGWVVSVMLPPMAVFFPLFTLLEDVGLLPRLAFNADRCFARCHACGKQCLTMAMGFGCNAVGVTECRIIQSRRERLIAVLTNALVPCNGRFPALIAVITCFFAGTGHSLRAALLLTVLIALSIAVTLLCSALLSRTVLRGTPSSFVLEMPPFRRPQLLRILVRSVLDRTVFVLGRAVVTAAPVSLLIWVLANCRISEQSLLSLLAGLLNPFGILLGLDGVILLAFLLGLPANEIVLPVAVTAYLGCTALTDYGSYAALHTLLTANGWTLHTAACFLILTLFHAPCATTLLTVRRETGSRRLTAAAFLLPSVVGILLTGGLSALLTLCGL